MDRRQFVMLSGATTALTQVRRVELFGAQPPEDDPVLDQLVQDAAAVALRLQARRSIRGEDFRSAASGLRLLAAHGRAKGLDAKIQRAIRRQGRAALLTFEHDQHALTGLTAAAKRFGLEMPTNLVSPTYDQRNIVIDQLLKKDGLSTLLTSMAATLAAYGTVQDRISANTVNGVQVRPVQVQDPPPVTIPCNQLYGIIAALQSLILIVCYPPIGLVYPGGCVALELQIIALTLLAQWQGC
jgi:hypothetical protein